MQDHLHAAAFVEETFEYDAFCVGTVPSTRRPSVMYSAICTAASGADRFRLAAPSNRRMCSRTSPISADSSARPRRPFAEPEGNGRRLALCVGDSHDAALDLQDSPGGVAELKDVADVGFDGKVFIERADERSSGSWRTR